VLISSPRWPGLSFGSRSQRLLYNSAAETLVHELAKGPVQAIFFRRDCLCAIRIIRHMSRLANPAEDISYESPVTCEKPSGSGVQFLQAGQGTEGWGLGRRVFLQSQLEGTCTSSFLRKNCDSQSPMGRFVDCRNWFRCRKDARTVYVTIGIEKVVSGGGVVHYYLAKIDLADQEARILSTA